MSKYHRTQDIVEDALINFPELRDNDNLLYIHICRQINPLALSTDLETALTKRKDLGIPSVETVGRCRRKVQETYPNLKASAKAQEARFEEWREVMDYVSC